MLEIVVGNIRFLTNIKKTKETVFKKTICLRFKKMLIYCKIKIYSEGVTTR